MQYNTDQRELKAGLIVEMLEYMEASMPTASMAAREAINLLGKKGLSRVTVPLAKCLYTGLLASNAQKVLLNNHAREIMANEIELDKETFLLIQATTILQLLIPAQEDVLENIKKIKTRGKGFG
jgi:hypothetical protein